MTTAAWYVPELSGGSGGLRTVFAMAHALQQHGVDTRIYLENSVRHPRQDIRARFGYDFAGARRGWRPDPEADIAIATVWYSAPFVAGLGCRHKFYFVQDYEAHFHPVGDAYLMAENTYSLDLTLITMGRWLAHHIHEVSGRPCYPLEFGVDDGIYAQSEQSPPTSSASGCALASLAPPQGGSDYPDQSQVTAGHPALCFINQPHKPRRCSGLGHAALALFHREHPEVDIYLYGGRGKVGHGLSDARFKHRNLGPLSLRQCAALYNRCSVGLCISATNPSRIPFEMMACGLPVVDVYRENNLYDYESGSVTLAQQTPAAIAEALGQLFRDPQLRARRGAAAAEFMLGRNQEYEAEQFVGIIDKVLSGELQEAGKIDRWYSDELVTASTSVATDGGLQRQQGLRRWYFRLLRLLPGPLALRLDDLFRRIAGRLRH